MSAAWEEGMLKLSRLAVAGAVGLALLAGGAARAGEAASKPLDRRPLLRFVFENLGRLADLREQLDLSAEQKQKLKSLLKSRKPEIVEAMMQIRAGRKKVLAAVRAEPVNEGTIRAAVAGLTKPLTDAAILRSKIRHDALALLNAEQRDRVDTFITETQASGDKAFEELRGK